MVKHDIKWAQLFRGYIEHLTNPTFQTHRRNTLLPELKPVKKQIQEHHPIYVDTWIKKLSLVRQIRYDYDDGGGVNDGHDQNHNGDHDWNVRELEENDDLGGYENDHDYVNHYGHDYESDYH